MDAAGPRKSEQRLYCRISFVVGRAAFALAFAGQPNKVHKDANRV
jgi:hypothetical protein